MFDPVKIFKDLVFSFLKLIGYLFVKYRDTIISVYGLPRNNTKTFSCIHTYEDYVFELTIRRKDKNKCLTP